MAIIKKIAFVGLLAAIGMALFRFSFIVVRAIREELGGKPAKSHP